MNRCWPLIVLLTAIGTAFADDEPPGRRPSCSFPTMEMRSYLINDHFFVEKKKILPISKLLKKGDTLFYVQLIPATKVAIPQDVVVDKDRSPLTAGFRLEPGKHYSVPFTFSADGKEFYDMVYVSGFLFESWIPVHPDGMLCGNTFSFRNHKALDGGMPRIYQSAPLKFDLIEQPDATARAVAITINDIDSATIKLQMSVMIGGKSVRQQMESFDMLAGNVALGNLVFDFVAQEQGVQVKGITEPTNYSEWMRSYLKIN